MKVILRVFHSDSIFTQINRKKKIKTADNLITQILPLFIFGTISFEKWNC